MACRTEYSLRIYTCPRCHGTEIVQTGMVPVPLSEVVYAGATPGGRAPVVSAGRGRGRNVPKISVNGGPTYADQIGETVADEPAAGELLDDGDAPEVSAAAEGVETSPDTETQAGTSTSPSSETLSASSPPSEPASPKPARTTASR